MGGDYLKSSKLLHPFFVHDAGFMVNKVRASVHISYRGAFVGGAGDAFNVQNIHPAHRSSLPALLEGGGGRGKGSSFRVRVVVGVCQRRRCGTRR